MAEIKHFLIVYGVSGSGKTLISKMLANHLKIQFIEGDNFHPKENIEKMKNGISLTDADRLPWLNHLKKIISEKIALSESFVLSCSALKLSYRDVLRQAGHVNFLLLDVPQPILKKRMENRVGHFMPLSLLQNQLLTLEKPTKKEKDILTFDASMLPGAIIKHIISALPIS